MKKYFLLFIALSISFTACNDKKEAGEKSELELKMNSIAEDYVKLILKIGKHDPDFVDAYYGPDKWKPAEEEKAGIDELEAEIDSLLNSLEDLSSYKANELETLRYRYLYKQLLAAKTKLFMIKGGSLSFEEEAKALYDAEPPVYTADHFTEIIDELNRLVPGAGKLSDRIADFKKDFIIPKEKLDTVFQTAINECRRKTLSHIKLPKEENFTIEYVTDKPYGGYNWYKGNSYSVIEVNTDLPIYIDRAIDLAAHEGYPGHHVYNLLLEKNMVKKHGWMEFSVYPLFSPQSLIAEGSANFGIEMVFPGSTRAEYEKEFLFPLAGIDTSKAELYYKILSLQEQLGYAGNEAARHYLNNDWPKEETIDWLGKYLLMNKERAEKRLSFIDKYRSYVINYNYGKDLVKFYIEKNGGTTKNPDLRWQLFERLLSTPQTPSGLTK